jgi:The  BURPS668_1122 family of deaminases
MDTDAEYKALSAIADTLDLFERYQQKGKLYLYTEREPCESCNYVLQQFKNKYPLIEIAEIWWDYPYPPV